MWVRISVFLTPLLLVIGVIVIVVLFLDRRSEPLSPTSPHYDEAASLDLSAGQSGVLAHESGARIEVPNGAVTESVAVSIREVPLPPSPLEVGRVFDFSLANGRFTEPVTIRIPFELDYGLDASEVVPLRWEADRNAWSELSGEVDASTQTVAVTTPEVGMFSTVARRTLDSARGDPPGAPATSSPLLEHNVLWEDTTTGAVPSTSAVVSDDVVYFGGCRGHRNSSVYAFDMATGSLLWRQGWGSQVGSCVMSRPVVSDGIVYVVSPCEVCRVVWGKLHGTRGDVSALDASTGELLWRYDNSVANTSWPVVSDGRVYIMSSGGRVIALDGMTGTVLWQYKASAGLFLEPSIDEPIVSGGVVYFRGNSGLYALDAITGRLLWRYKVEDVEDGGSSSEIVVSRGIVYAGFYDGYTYALDAGTGDLLWRSETGVLRRPLTDSLRGSSPVVSGGVVYTGSVGYGTRFNGRVSALAASTGEVLWQYEVYGSVEFSPIVSRGVVYAASWDSTPLRGGHVYALDAVTGALLWQHDTYAGQRWSAPVVSGDIVYVGTGSQPLPPPGLSSLYALDAETGALRWEPKLDPGRVGVVGIVPNSSFGDVVFFVSKETRTNRIVAIAVERMPEGIE